MQRHGSFCPLFIREKVRGKLVQSCKKQTRQEGLNENKSSFMTTAKQRAAERGAWLIIYNSSYILKPQRGAEDTLMTGLVDAFPPFTPPPLCFWTFSNAVVFACSPHCFNVPCLNLRRAKRKVQQSSQPDVFNIYWANSEPVQMKHQEDDRTNKNHLSSVKRLTWESVHW